MRNFLKFLILAPVALLFLAFAMANRQNVVVSFDPFRGGDIRAPQIVLPLFIVLIAAVMFGVVLGGAATWFRQRRFRKAAREARARAENLHSEIESLRGELAATKSSAAPPASSGGAMVAAREHA